MFVREEVSKPTFNEADLIVNDESVEAGQLTREADDLANSAVDDDYDGAGHVHGQPSPASR